MTKFLTKAAFAATAATMLVAAPAIAADASDTFKATAIIMKPLSLANDEDLDFGTITMNPGLTTSETVTVAAAAGESAVCGSAALTCLDGAPAKFTLTGVAGQSIDVNIDNPPATLARVGGGGSVALALDPVADVDLDDTGSASFYVGGTITVLASTVDGTYEATVNVTADYL